MNYTIKRENNYLIVSVIGEIDISLTDSLRDDVDQALEDYGVNQLIFDLTEVDFVDSAGLGVILGRYKRIAARGGKVYLAGAKPQVKKVLDLSGLPRLMETHPSVHLLLDKIG
ncbi:STAS domain-containing protein [Desulfallas thermosapovorans]|uniref:Anti-sigma factor antagonist n=1 Tax=Desulfallas thermosapovorans DSM 6562 TaxID=1121431 RepID=A0A5S4ZSG1_9FIRM|nr:anti-sigma factor antagonist [Desulfallas thermosapovorans]TYO95592.1 SpoIIAA-like anti-anti-sigma regulatory factor [Desulfallas thermosapovorans DSM 6562]